MDRSVQDVFWGFEKSYITFTNPCVFPLCTSHWIFSIAWTLACNRLWTATTLTEIFTSCMWPVPFISKKYHLRHHVTWLTRPQTAGFLHFLLGFEGKETLRLTQCLKTLENDTTFNRSDSKDLKKFKYDLIWTWFILASHNTPLLIWMPVKPWEITLLQCFGNWNKADIK